MYIFQLRKINSPSTQANIYGLLAFMDDVIVLKYLVRATGSLGPNDGKFRIYRDRRSSQIYEVETRTWLTKLLMVFRQQMVTQEQEN